MMITPTTCVEELNDALALLDQGFSERTVDIDGGVVSYRTSKSGGGGLPIVLLHGIGSGAASWLQCSAALQQTLETASQVIAWNAPGYSNSSPLPMARPSAADYAWRLEQFLQALDLSGCLLVGHSLGAMMASAYIAAGYGRVSELVLLSPAQGYGSDQKRLCGQEIAQQRLDALRSVGVDGIALKSSERVLSAQASAFSHAWVKWNTQKLIPAGYEQAVHMLCGDDIHRYLPARLTAAVYCGDADVVTSAEESRILAENYQLPFQLIDNAGHACYVEQPALVAGVIRRHFINLSKKKS